MPDEPRRRSPRHPSHDYATPWLYFVTFRVHTDARVVLSRITDENEVELFEAGWIVDRCLNSVQSAYGMTVNCSVIMPNHVHIVLDTTTAEKRIGVSSVVGFIKGSSGAWIRRARGRIGVPVWQRGFHDRVIRDAGEHASTRRYIAMNPVRWNARREDHS